MSNQKETLKTILRDFAVTTSMDGWVPVMLTHRQNPRRWKNKVFLIGLMGCIGIAMFIVTQISMKKYFSGPEETTISIDHRVELEFPAVTFCNTNKLKSGHADPQQFPTEEYSGGHTIKEMLTSCSFRGVPCNSSSFYWHWSDRVGNCYTFNNHRDNAGSKVPSKKVYVTGSQSSLVLTLDLHTEAYSDWTPSVGAILTIHERDKRPNPTQTASYAVPNGFYTSVKAIQEEVNHKESQESKCQKKDDEKFNRGNNFFADKYSYSMEACIDSCVQVQFIRYYGCCSNKYPCNPLKRAEMFGVRIDPDTSLCSEYVNNRSSTETIKRWIRKRAMYCRPFCLPACARTLYTVQMSYLRWPGVKSRYQKTHSETCKARNITCRDGTDEIQENMLMVKFFPETFDVTTYQRKSRYDLLTTLTRIGGTLDLCLGFSLICCLEFIELLFDITCYLCLKLLVRLGIVHSSS